MKYLDNLIMKGSLVKVWFASVGFATILWGSMWTLFDWMLSVPNKFSLIGYVVLGIVLGTIITALVYLMRSADKFFRKADAIEEKAKAATTKQELADLWNNEFIPLTNESFHKQTGFRIRELGAIIKTKHDTLTV